MQYSWHAETTAQSLLSALILNERSYELCYINQLGCLTTMVVICGDSSYTPIYIYWGELFACKTKNEIGQAIDAQRQFAA